MLSLVQGFGQLDTLPTETLHLEAMEATKTRRFRAFLQLGVEASWARRFAYSRMGGWAIACSPIMGTTVTEARLRQKGYIPFLEYYLNVKYGNKTESKPKKKS
jgi:hypothetical protein